MLNKLIKLSILNLLTTAVIPLVAQAQGSIFGQVQNSDSTTPPDGNVSFFGFLDDTDEEIRIESSTGAGYGSGNWFDDFQNYLTEAPGNPYDYFFTNAADSEGFHLAALIPDNSFQQEDIELIPVNWPSQPNGLTAVAVSSSTIVISWNGVPGLTYHVYRLTVPSNGSFFRIDNTVGSLTDPGISDSFFVDTTVDGVNSFDYLIIAEDDSGNYSEHSATVTVSSAAAAAPVLDSLIPDTGDAAGGTLVNVYGSGFDPADAGVTIDGAALTGVTVVSPFHITGLTPAGSPGPADVLVTNTVSGLSSNTLVNGFTYTGAGCCIGIRGNVDSDPEEKVNIADLTYLVEFLFKGGPPPICLEEGNADGDVEEKVNIADLTYLVEFLFKGGPQPPPCP